MPKFQPRRRNEKRVRGEFGAIPQSERIVPQRVRQQRITPRRPAPPFVPRPRPIRQPGR
jgi:hypothetical protein